MPDEKGWSETLGPVVLITAARQVLVDGFRTSGPGFFP
jgi:hypothetical protein